MKLGIMQPYFLPYIGYFQLINAVDKYVIYDDVNYIKGGWINRNRLLSNERTIMFTLSLLSASPNKLINQISISPDHRKLLKTIEASYKKAPQYSTVFPLIQGIICYSDLNLAKYIGNSIIQISNYLNINTQFLYSSEIREKNNSLRAQEKIINICSVLGGNHYINAIGGVELYSKARFEEKDIALNFLRTRPITYRQYNNEFVPFLSILDVLMFNTVEKINEMLGEYELS